MTILKDISRARIEFYKTQGKYPSRLVVCPNSFERLKAQLFRGTHINTRDLPLSRYDQMEVVVIENRSGWDIE